MGLNFLFSKIESQIDLTSSNRYSLSKESLLLLEKVESAHRHYYHAQKLEQAS